MASQATIIRDSLEDNWSLTGRLSKVPLDNMKEIVRFFDRQQVEGNEWPKAVVVRKINAEGKENQEEDPNNLTLRDIYEITLYYRVVDVQEISYSEALQDAEDMGTEIQRILDLSFSPSMNNGIFWNVTRDWAKHDHLDSAQPELRRTLTMRLSKKASFDGTLFEGYNGELHFDSPLGHNYSQIFNIDTVSGYPQIPEPIVGQSNPVFFTGVLDGILVADMYVHPDDIGIEEWDINQIGTVNANGEVLEAVLIQSYPNENGDTITITTDVKVTSALYIANVEDLLKFRLTAQVIDYPTTVIT